MDFPAWFREATGYEPFPYQVQLATDPAWPDALAVPTGLGKTAGIVLGWLWRRRFADPRVREATPRRLVYCLPMRVLVEQTAEQARRWLDRLGLLAECPGDDRPAPWGPAEPRIAVSVVMGGEEEDDWDRYPERDAVLVGTQDLLLSRALNRGYAMSRSRWPMHFALLHNDAAWVFDEVQLMGAALPTSAQLEAFRRQWGTARPCRSLWASATLDPGWLDTVDFGSASRHLRILRLSAADLDIPTVRQRVAAAKRLQRATVRLTGDNDLTYVRQLAAEVSARHRPGTTTLVILNRVARAQALYQALSRALPDDVETLLIHARFRPPDRRRLEARLREPPTRSGGRIVVATQAVEAGVDVSARTLCTEIAPWASLVQRFGRCNRYGEAPAEGPDAAAVYVVDLADGLRDRRAADAAAPYPWEAIEAARRHLADLTDAAPLHLPAVYALDDDVSVLRRRDLLDLFDTTPDWAGADVDVARYVRDEADTDVQVFWRTLGPGWDPRVMPMPAPDELVSVSLAQLRRYLAAPSSRGARRAYRWDVVAGQWVDVDSERLHPGLTLMLDAAGGGYHPEWGFVAEAFEPVDPVPAGGAWPDDDAADPLSELPRFVPLGEHLADTAAEAERLAAILPGRWDVPAVIRAALRHDTGKATAVFQATLTRCLPEDDPRRHELWAKSPCRARHARPHYRHELVSALAALLDGEEDLVAYLVAAHHGKVRLSIRSMPDEEQPGDGRLARGVRDGDVVSAVSARGEVFPEHVLTLEWMDMGLGPRGPSWTERTLGLLRRHGPFVLAWMETLVRLADWRASQRERAARVGAES